ncbi:MAG: hypothetical protein GTO02_17915 [Candidatus Dadabacteria bacterium]|nr:hypothetical protein [Candidatus Dadabacteria bacterium]
MVLIAIYLISLLPQFKEIHTALMEYLKILIIPIILGFLIGGVIDYFVPQGFIYKYLGKKSIGSLFYALVSGLLMSSCSHGILAISIELYKKGASIPAVITFLLASPWANFPITILLISFFGWKGALFILAAMIIALITGAIFLILDKFQMIESSNVKELGNDYSWDRIKNFDLNNSIRGVLRGSLILSNMVLWWLIVGLIVTVLINVYVPNHFLMNYFGPTLSGLILTLAVATVFEVCSEGSSLIALEIYKSVGSFGNPFVFLMAGVVTDYTEIGLLWTNIGRKTAIWLPIIAVPQVVIFGIIFNKFL